MAGRSHFLRDAAQSRLLPPTIASNSEADAIFMDGQEAPLAAQAGGPVSRTRVGLG